MSPDSFLLKYLEFFNERDLTMWKWIRSFFSPGDGAFEASKNKHILVVDDSETERVFYARTLERAGYEITAAESGPQALGLVRQRRPDLILTDFYMPEMNGREMCRILKEDPQAADIPVIFLTGSTKPADVIDCFDAGCEHFLEKPIDAKCLVRQVNTVLGDLEQERAAGITL